MFNFRPRIFFDGSETSGGGEPAPGPWAEDLSQYFGELGEEAVAAADRYLREKIQPHTTQLETKLSEASVAQEWLNDLQTNPDETLKTLIEQRYGDEFAAEYERLFGEETPDEETPDEPDEETPLTAELPEEDRELLEWARTKREAELRDKRNEEYQKAKAEAVAKAGLTEADAEVLDPFVAAAGGDIEEGIARYQRYVERFAEQHGFVKPEPAPEENAPPVVDAGTGGGVPPLANKPKKFGELPDALRAVLDRTRQNPPPVVG